MLRWAQAPKLTAETHQVWQLHLSESGGQIIFLLFSAAELPSRTKPSTGPAGALAHVLESIATRRPTVPFHKSKLAMLLRCSLLSRCPAVCIACIQGSRETLAQSSRTMKFLKWIQSVCSSSHQSPGGTRNSPLLRQGGGAALSISSQSQSVSSSVVRDCSTPPPAETHPQLELLEEDAAQLRVRLAHVREEVCVCRVYMRLIPVIRCSSRRRRAKK